MSLVNNMYKVKSSESKEDYTDYEYIQEQLNVLKRYCLTHDYSAPNFSVYELYKYFTKQVGIMEIYKAERDVKLNWLFKVSKYIKEHEQEEINLTNID